MNRIIAWFWWLVFLWFFTTFGAIRVVFGAETDEQLPAASSTHHKKPSTPTISFAKDAEEARHSATAFEPITPITSRLSSFKSRLSDIPANVSYVPFNVTYKTPAELEHANARAFQDSVRDIEGGIFYDEVGNNLDTTFSLRGFSAGSAVIFLVDGVRVNEVDGDAVNYPLIPMNDVEFIQIDRGSASPIYGSGAFAGVVNVMTKKPSPKRVTLFGGTELSSFKGIKFNQGIGGSILDHLSSLGGRLTYYFNGGRDLNDGFRDNGDWRITAMAVGE